MKQWFKDAFTEVKGEISITIEDTVAEGNKISSRLTMRWNNGTKDITGRYIAISRIENDRIIEHWHYGIRDD